MAVVVDPKTGVVPDLDDLLQCPVCYEVPGGHIYQCNEGHHVCGSCKSRIDVCPVCRSLFFGTRNYAMEELIANLKKFKICKSLVATGSSTSESTESADTSLAAADSSLLQEPAADEAQAEQRRVPAVSCSGVFRCLCCRPGATERLPMARMLNHLRYWHPLDLIEGKSEGGEYVQAWQFRAARHGRIATAVRVSDMGIFFLVIEITEANLYAWVSMAAAPWVAPDFHYNLTISGNDREAVFSDNVCSTRSCEGQLKKRQRCLSVTGANLRALMASRMMSGRLTIKRATSGDAPLAQPRAVLRVAYRGASDDASVSSHESWEYESDEEGRPQPVPLNRTPRQPTVVRVPSQQAAARTPQQVAARTPQQVAARTPQQATARTPQQVAARTPQQAAARTPQQVAARTPQQAAARTPQQAAARTPQQTAARTVAQPAVALASPQQTIARASQQAVAHAPQPAVAHAAAQPAAVSSSAPLSRNARRRMRRQLNHEISSVTIAPPADSNVSMGPVNGVPATSSGGNRRPAAAAVDMNQGSVTMPSNTVGGPVAPANVNGSPVEASHSSGESSQPTQAGPRRRNNKKGRARR